MDLDWNNVGTGIAGLVIGAGGMLAGWRRSSSREGVEAAKDVAETNLISRLESERDEAREEAKHVRDQRVADASRIARLEAENENLQHHIRRLVRALPQEEREIFETDFAPMCDIPPEKKP